MKDYKTTEIWARMISSTCYAIDESIKRKKEKLKALQGQECRSPWEEEEVEELQEEIHCLEWQINQLICPFKIKNK